MDYHSRLDGLEETNYINNINEHGRCKVFLLTSFLFMSKTFELVWGWPEGLIVPFNNKSDLLAKYDETPSPVLIMADDCALIGELVGEILSSFSGYSLAILSDSSKDILRDQFEKNKIFPEFEDCLKEDIIIHHQLPCSIEKIKSLAKQINFKKNTLSVKQHEVLNKINNRITDKYDADQRHKMGNYMAADRILNGACRSGHYNLNNSKEWERACKAYEILIKNNDKWSNEQKTIQLNDAIKALKKFKKKFDEYKQSPLWHESINHILIIDDEIDMWKPVWSFIFGSDKVTIIGNPSEAIQHLKDNDNKYDFVILDLNLGEGNPNGLSIIPVIKGIRFDLPVIVMTAYDNAEIVREAYMRGASFCFVKERRDKIDRKSTDYFDMLKKIFTFIPLNSSIERKICNEFRIIEPFIEHSNPDACAELRRAVFYLLLDPTEIRARKYLFGTSKEEWPRYQLIAKGCYDSFEIFIQKLLEDQRIHFDPRTNADNKYTLLKNNGHSIPKPVKLKLYHGTGHEINEEEKAIYAKEPVLEFFQHIINYYKNYYKDKIVIKDYAENMEVLSPQLVMYEHQNDAEKSHDERGKVGALRLLEGAYLHKFDESQYGRENIRDRSSVDELIAEYDELIMSLLQKEKPKFTGIFIDDNGVKSGWKRALDLLLPESYIRYLEFKKSTRYEDVLEAAGKTDFVILDLRLPKEDGTLSEDVGIDLLEAIVEKYPYLPVITLTASDDAFYFRQVMSIGAFDYFPKTDGTFFKCDSNKYFSAYYLHFADIMKKLYHYLQNIKPITLLLKRFDNFNHFRSLDSLDISGMNNAFWGNKSRSINSKVSGILQRSFFFLLGHQNISMHYLLNRLYRNNVQHSEWTMENHGYVECIKASEYCLQILRTLYCKDYSVKYNKYSMGDLCTKPDTTTDKSFWIDNKDLIKDINKLWQKRNDIAHRGKIFSDPIKLIEQATNNAVDVARSIDNKVRKDFVIKHGNPQWDLALLLGRAYFKRAIGDVLKIFENIVEYNSRESEDKTKTDYYEGLIHRTFRSLIKSSLEKSDKSKEVENILKENMNKWLLLFDTIPDKEMLEKENQALSIQLKTMDEIKKELDHTHYAFMERLSGTRIRASATKATIEKETKEYNDKIAKNRSDHDDIKKKIENNKQIIDSIKYKTQYYIDTRNDVLDKWYHENITMETHMEKKKLLSNYLEWEGIIDYDDFNNCFSDVFDESLKDITKFCLSFRDFSDEILKEKKRKDRVTSIVKKLYEYLTIEGIQNKRCRFEWQVSYNQKIKKHYLTIDNISIPINNMDDLPKGISVGKHMLTHWCCKDGYIKYELVKNS